MNRNFIRSRIYILVVFLHNHKSFVPKTVRNLRLWEYKKRGIPFSSEPMGKPHKYFYVH